MGDKKRTFITYDDGIGERVITGDVEQTLNYIRAYLEEAEDGCDEIVFCIKRSDMTKDEMEAAPVI